MTVAFGLPVLVRRMSGVRTIDVLASK
jgi:hypothetical protein